MWNALNNTGWGLFKSWHERMTWLVAWTDLSLTVGSAGLILQYVHTHTTSHYITWHYTTLHYTTAAASITTHLVGHKPMWALPLAHPAGDDSCLTAWISHSHMQCVTEMRALAICFYCRASSKRKNTHTHTHKHSGFIHCKPAYG